MSRVSARAVLGALGEREHEARALEIDIDLATTLVGFAPDVVLPVAHGALGEDGCLQGLLEILGLPYVGSDVRASAIAADKVASKVFFRSAGLPLAEQTVVLRGESLSLAEARQKLGPAVIVKPASGGSTVGVTRLLAEATEADFVVALAGAHELDARALVETYCAGSEFTCGVLDGADGPRALPPTLIEAQASDWYDFQSKYAEQGSQHRCPAPLLPEETALLQALAVRAHQALGARDLSRSDFIRVAPGSFVLLELNSLPGMTGVSLFPEAAQAAGIAFPDLIDGLVRRAAERGPRAELVAAARLAPKIPDARA